MAFISLGGDNKMSIPYDKVIRFLLFVFNNETRYLDKIMEICRALDEKVNGTIEVNEFMQICKIISSNNNLMPPRFMTWRKLNRFHGYFQDKLKLKDFFNSRKFNIVLGFIIIITFINCILTIYTDIKAFGIIDDILLYLYIVEVLFRLATFGAE